jgi:hypothetical protein
LSRSSLFFTANAIRGIFAKIGTKESIEIRLWKIMGYEKKAGISLNQGYKE